VQLVYPDYYLELHGLDVAVEAFNKLGMKIAEYFKTT
jgi:hypothetical protein